MSLDDRAKLFTDNHEALFLMSLTLICLVLGLFLGHWFTVRGISVECKTRLEKPYPERADSSHKSH